MIKGLFHAAARIAAHRDDDAPPAPSRRRSGKTEGEFCRLARGLLRAISRRSVAARGRYAALRNPSTVPPATPTSAISIPVEFMYADTDWNVFDISNPLYDHGDGFENNGSFDSRFDAVNEYLSPGL